MPYSRHGRLLLRQRHVPRSPSSGTKEDGGHIPAQGLLHADCQEKDLTRNDRHALNMAAFRIPCLMQEPHPTEFLWKRIVQGSPSIGHEAPGKALSAQSAGDALEER